MSDRQLSVVSFKSPIDREHQGRGISVENQAAGHRLYVGNLSCPAFLAEEYWFLTEDEPLTLVLPPVPEAYFNPLASLLEKLAVRQQDDEVTVNDLGTLHYCHEQGIALKINVGPLLAGQDTAPEIDDFITGRHQVRRNVYHDGKTAELCYRQPPEALITHWQTPTAVSLWPMLEQFDISRVEVTHQPAGFGEIGCPLSLYEGFVPLTILPCRDCSTCPKEAALYYQDSKIELYRKQNMIFYKPEIPTIPDAADRLIRHYIDNAL